jgi:galactosamine-6-phosphate isomerase
MKPARDRASLEIEVAENHTAISRRAEQLIVSELKQKPDLLLCASAGATPTQLYELLATRCRRQPRLFKRMRVLQIDEWGGLERGHPATCESDLKTKLLKPLGIGRDRFFGFRTEARSPELECARVERWLATNGPIDICLLGLGLNGHVAMNEPAAALIPRVHVAGLARSSLNHPMLKSLSRKPRHGMTVGMGGILSSRIILLLVNGRHKRAPLKRLRGPIVTTQFPASFLWLHPRAIVLCDRDAAPISRRSNG